MDRGVKLLVVAGLMTHLAVDTTARRHRARLSHHVAGDATATRSAARPARRWHR
jgi:nicotinamidase-related amidase